MILHLLRYQGFEVDDYSVSLECLEPGASSTFATLGQKHRLLLTAPMEYSVFKL